MEFNLYKYFSTDIYEKWTRFPATVLGLAENGAPYVDLWRQERKKFKDELATVVNKDLGKITVSLADIGDPSVTSFPLLHPVTGETIGAMTVSEFIAAAYSLGIWLDQRQDAPVVSEPGPEAPAEPEVPADPPADPVVPTEPVV